MGDFLVPHNFAVFFMLRLKGWCFGLLCATAEVLIIVGNMIDFTEKLCVFAVFIVWDYKKYA